MSAPSRPFPILLLSVLVALGACNSKSSAEVTVPPLAAGVDLTGRWNVTTRVTSLLGETVLELGEPDCSTVELAMSGADLTIDAGTADEVAGTLDGARFSALQEGEDRRFTLELTFDRTGTTCTGRSVRSLFSNGLEIQRFEFAVSGARVAAEGLAVELAWTAAVDLDLEVIEPDGAVCTFADTGEVATEAGGSHSGDANAFCTMQITNLERVTYPATRPAGSYRARAALADDCALNQRGFFTLTVRGAGLTSGAASGDLAVSGEVTATFTTSLPFDVVDDS